MMTAPEPNLIRIDDREIPFVHGETIMDAALAADVYIPHLCHFPGITPQGNCKLCTVEVDGKPLTACTSPAAAGQQIRNNIPELNEARKVLTQMLFIEGNHICPSCEKTGNCALQAMAYHLGMLHQHFPQQFPEREVDASHPTIMLDRIRCILCSLCVRASQEVDGKNVFAIAGRGIHASLIVNTASGKLVDSDLEPSDLAARICPVGAILIKEHGYDAPIGKRIFDQHKISEIGLEKIYIAGAKSDDS
ncbi:2Fe-2S iron-sulfur cluster-binding protein [Nitrosomonas communis]|uniref:[NiFe] hydrogenase diaphorase moiety small subunit n=1 Tax=Nitrosomonas communis TaxID=44574 RepID=A0A1I4NS42_9PROT|nr:2Fe-2S iron-sulfur cluster-binding protein [Nitrosomonas communis]SFM18180.1 [NiFe] hydrogenase diaphorase moiety small subunit [Nitrosomonas communis]